jgi:hypothetical protein
MTLFDWLQMWNWMMWTVRPYTPRQVINYFLRYSSDPSSQDYDYYCCVRLMLYHLFTDLTDLLAFDGCVYRSYIDAF